jgi:hypothetical protein
VSLANDVADPVGAYLISPDGDTLGYGQNYLETNFTSSTVRLTPGRSLTAYTLNPKPGTWTLIVDFAEPVVGNEVSEPYSGNISFNHVRVHASGLPDSTAKKLTRGHAVTVPITITNRGAAPEDFFIDPRLSSTASIQLASLTKNTGLTLPLTVNGGFWIVPTHTSRLSVAANATLPIMFDFSANAGDPDISSAGPGAGALCADTESASYAPSGGTVTTGLWNSFPSECGPYASQAPAGTLKYVNMTARTRLFDPAVSSHGGDFWLEAINPAAPFAPIVVKPGQTRVIKVTIKPSAKAGTKVHGTLYVDVFAGDIPPYGQGSGDELAGLPYAYTIK